MTPIKIAHIINPVKVNPKSDLYIAQPITFETMRRSKNNTSPDVSVELYTTQYPEDHEILPEGFNILTDLKHSVLDFSTFQHPRKLPLLREILDQLFEASDADYFIYTNVDIAVMPFYYQTIAYYIRQGYDAMVINRRTISPYTNITELPLMYSELGETHPGSDCFVFKRSIYPSFRLENVVIGAPCVGKIFLWNLILHSQNYLYLPDKHLTFHIGNERVWKNQKYNEYAYYNKKETKKAYRMLEQDMGSIVKSRLEPYLNNACGRFIYRS